MASQQQKRAQDIAESHHLLLELLSSEPFMQECLQMIENICLSRELDFTTQHGKGGASARVGVSHLAARICMRGLPDVKGVGTFPSTGWEEPQLAVAR